MSDDWQQLISKTRNSLSGAPGFNRGPVNVGDAERAVSAVGGIALVGYGLKRRDGWGAAAALGGLALLHRGYTGYCVVGDLVGRDSAAPAQVPVAAEGEGLLELSGSAAAVYAAWADPSSCARLLGHIQSVDDLGDGLTRWTPRLTAQALGLPAAVDCERIIDQPGQALAWRSRGDGPVAFQLTVGIEPVADDRSRARVALSWRPRSPEHARRLHPDLAGLVAADIERAGEVLAGLVSPSGADALPPRTVAQGEE